MDKRRAGGPSDDAGASVDHEVLLYDVQRHVRVRALHVLHRHQALGELAEVRAAAELRQDDRVEVPGDVVDGHDARQGRYLALHLYHVALRYVDVHHDRYVVAELLRVQLDREAPDDAQLLQPGYPVGDRAHGEPEPARYLAGAAAGVLGQLRQYAPVGLVQVHAPRVAGRPLSLSRRGTGGTD
jgi:hypothetical protein